MRAASIGVSVSATKSETMTAPATVNRIVRECKRIMESTCQHKLSVPIVVDTEYFTTNWKEKKKMEAFN